MNQVWKCLQNIIYLTFSLVMYSLKWSSLSSKPLQLNILSFSTSYLTKTTLFHIHTELIIYQRAKLFQTQVFIENYIIFYRIFPRAPIIINPIVLASSIIAIAFPVYKIETFQITTAFEPINKIVVLNNYKVGLCYFHRRARS